MKRFVSLLLLTIILMANLASCGDKYCSVPDCPKEHSRRSDYCFEHKCMNSSCNNRATYSYGYCSKCLNKE